MNVQEQGIGNLMTVTVETMYSPPESWTMAGTQYAYATALPVPVSADVCLNYFYVILLDMYFK